MLYVTGGSCIDSVITSRPSLNELSQVYVKGMWSSPNSLYHAEIYMHKVRTKIFKKSISIKNFFKICNMGWKTMLSLIILMMDSKNYYLNINS